MNEKIQFTQNISCIVNPRAARNKWQRRRRLRNYLQKNLPGKIIDTHGIKEHTIEIARKQSLVSKMIVAVGGDGTIADVIQGIIDSGNGKNTVLGFIPFGSGNAFRKSLGIPKNVKKAVQTLSKGDIKEIDLIDIDGRKVAGFASTGATAKVVQKKLQHKIESLPGHILASRILATISKEEQEIELIDGISDSGDHFEKKVINLSLFDCVICKTNHFGYSWIVAPKAKIDDGYLDVTLFETTGLKYLFNFPLIYFGLLQRRQKHFKVKKIIIQGKNLPVQYNGEFLGVRDRIEFKVKPRALKIICPKTSN